MTRIDVGRTVGIVAAACVTGLSGPALAADEARVALLEIEGAPLEKPEPLSWLFGSERPTLRQLTRTLDEAAARGDLDSLVVRLKDARLSATQVEELSRAIARVREAGKPVRVFSYTYDTTGLMLGAAADSVIVQDGGAVTFPGLYMEEFFLGDTLRWAGLEPQFVQVGDYKGASEAFMNAEPSEAWEDNITQLLDGLYANIREHVGDGRGLDEAGLDEAMRRAWMGTAETAIDVGLVDEAVDLATLGDFLGRTYQGGAEVSWVTDLGPSEDGLAFDPNDPMAPFKMMNTLMNPPEYGPDGPTIAVVHVNGPIIDGDSTPGGMFGGAQVGSRTIRNALEDILAEEDVKGVVVRINSPGGSAIASEVIWQGLRRVAAQKPVWASVGSMAASGGYYVAVGSDKIYANPSSIVGSIGVVGGKLSPRELMGRLKINAVGRARGPMADMFGTAPWTSEQEAAIRGKMVEIYDLFVERVRAGRPGIDVSRTAEGRLFTGDKAVGLKMVDEIGGLDEAVEDLAGELGLVSYDVLDYPAPKSLAEILEDTFGDFAGARVELDGRVAALREAVGPEAWAGVRAVLEGLTQLREEPVLMLLPRAIVVR